MGNFNFGIGKTFKGSLFGGDKNEKGEGKHDNDKHKKANTMRIPKVLAQNIIF